MPERRVEPIAKLLEARKRFCLGHTLGNVMTVSVSGVEKMPSVDVVGGSSGEVRLGLNKALGNERDAY